MDGIVWAQRVNEYSHGLILARTSYVGHPTQSAHIKAHTISVFCSKKALEYGDGTASSPSILGEQSNLKTLDLYYFVGQKVSTHF